jgi:hypothetical protein
VFVDRGSWLLCVVGCPGHGAGDSNLVLWLFAKALFDDAFRWRRWYLALWLLIVGAGLVDGLYLEPSGLPAAEPIRRLLVLQAVIFAALARSQTLATWRTDLVEPRRRLRRFVVLVAAGHTFVMALSGFIAAPLAPLAANTVDAGVLVVIAVVIAWSLLRVSGDEALYPPSFEARGGATATTSLRLQSAEALDRVWSRPLNIP